VATVVNSSTIPPAHYTSIGGQHLFAFIVVKTLGSLNMTTSQFFANLGRKISSTSGKELFCPRVSVIVQHYKAVFVTWHLVSPWLHGLMSWTQFCISQIFKLTHSAYSESFSWVARPIGEPVGPSQNFVCGFCGGTGMNYEGCEQNFGASQVIMRKGVSKGSNTSFCHPLSVSEPSCDTKPYYLFLMGLYGA